MTSENVKIFNFGLISFNVLIKSTLENISSYEKKCSLDGTIPPYKSISTAKIR
mgnify:CR=1 FL=1